MKAPIGALVSLYYDSPREIHEGDILVTTTKRMYLIFELRRQTKGLHVGRWHIRAFVVEERQLPDGPRVFHPIYWYRRRRRIKQNRV